MDNTSLSPLLSSCKLNCLLQSWTESQWFLDVSFKTPALTPFSSQEQLYSAQPAHLDQVSSCLNDWIVQRKLYPEIIGILCLTNGKLFGNLLPYNIFNCWIKTQLPWKESRDKFKMLMALRFNCSRKNIDYFQLSFPNEIKKVSLSSSTRSHMKSLWMFIQRTYFIIVNVQI